MPRSAWRASPPPATPRSTPCSAASRTTCSISAPISARRETAKGKGPGGERLTVTEAQVTRLEAEIDRLNADLAPLRSFVLPGGTAAAAYLHLARTICRRAERMMVELADTPDETVSASAIKYVNRLSDFLFVASRFVNAKGTGDVLWVPGRNR